MRAAQPGRPSRNSCGFLGTRLPAASHPPRHLRRPAHADLARSPENLARHLPADASLISFGSARSPTLAKHARFLSARAERDAPQPGPLAVTRPPARSQPLVAPWHRSLSVWPGVRADHPSQNPTSPGSTGHPRRRPPSTDAPGAGGGRSAGSRVCLCRLVLAGLLASTSPTAIFLASSSRITETHCPRRRRPESRRPRSVPHLDGGPCLFGGLRE